MAPKFFEYVQALPALQLPDISKLPCPPPVKYGGQVSPSFVQEKIQSRVHSYDDSLGVNIRSISKRGELHGNAIIAGIYGDNPTKLKYSDPKQKSQRFRYSKNFVEPLPTGTLPVAHSRMLQKMFGFDCNDLDLA